MPEVTLKSNKVTDKTYEIILDEKGKAVLNTDLLVGELRLLKIKIPNTMSLSPFYVKMFLDDFNILNETFDSDELYVLKVQSRDGFNQFFSQDSEFYLLNDNLRIEVGGIPFNSIVLTFRLMGE